MKPQKYRDINDSRLTMVRCTHCDTIYDLGNVKVIARYQDCSVWNCPGCQREVDDRRWKSLPDIADASQGRPVIDASGAIRYLPMDDGRPASEGSKSRKPTANVQRRVCGHLRFVPGCDACNAAKAAGDPPAGRPAK